MKNQVLKRDVSNARHNLSDKKLRERILTLNQNNTNENKSIEQELALKFKKEGFESLTAIQEKALPVIARKINCLLVAPTGSGKTEAAVLPIFGMVSSSSPVGSGNIRVVYITPLRALNNDVFRRIIKYAKSEGLRVEIRHSDSTPTTRRRIVESPPDILITTPESLGVVLSSEKVTLAMHHLEWVIVDEVHELIGRERGAHLSIGLERLQAASSRQITRIGLSATVGNLAEAANFISGASRKHAILVDGYKRQYDIELKYIDGSLNDVGVFIHDYLFANKIRGQVLLFTNTRDEAEFLATVLRNQNGLKVDVHHGSLSRTVREETEQSLRVGQAGVTVCTSSLELGLDIGSIELVMHYGSPRQVSKLVQRIGRSNHRQTTYAKGLVITNNPDDELETLAIIRKMKKGLLEEPSIHNNALDVVAHHSVGLCLRSRGAVPLKMAFDLFRSAYPFRHLSWHDLESCLDVLDMNGIIRFDREAQVYRRRIKAYQYYFENLSMIPHVLKFEVIDSVSKRKIGTLDQQFVEDYAEKGNVFILKGSQWRILSIDEKRMLLNVEPLHGIAINVPYWVGEMIPVDHNTSREVGVLRHLAMKNKLNLSSEVLQESAEILGVLPDSDNIVLERSTGRNMVVIHSMFGTKVNNTIACLLSTLLSSQLGFMVETRSDPYRILLTSSARIGKAHVENAFTDAYDLEPVIIASLAGTHMMNWRVWAVAKRFGTVSREALYDNKVARMLYDRHSKTAIGKESIRELMHDKYDIDNTRKVFDNLKQGIFRIHLVDVDEFSKLAKPILEHHAKFSANPLSIEKGILELVRERLEKTKHKLICIRCARWERTFETLQIPEKLSCPMCHSRLITATFWSDNDLTTIISKKLRGVRLLAEEEHRFDRAWKIASLINNFGKKALVVLAGYGVGADAAARILRNYVDDEAIYRSVYEAEKQYVMTRSFWSD